MAVSKSVISIYLHRPVITNTAPKTYHKQLLIIRPIDIKKEYTQDNQQLPNSAIKKVSMNDKSSTIRCSFNPLVNI